MIFERIVQNAGISIASKRLEKFEGKEVEIIVRRKRKKRSLPQNAYYWGVIVHLVSEHTGYKPIEIHAYHKAKLWPFTPQKFDIFGELVPVENSTKTLTTAQFAELCDHLRQFWAQHDIDIPAPNEIPVELYEQAVAEYI